MNKTKYQDQPSGVQRRSILEAHSDGVEEKEIFRPMSAEEIKTAEHELAEIACEMQGHDETLDKAKQIHKGAVTPLKSQYAYLRNKIRAKGESIMANVYKFFNHEDGTVEYYDDEGTMVDVRPMKPSEKNQFLSKSTTAIRHIADGTHG